MTHTPIAILSLMLCACVKPVAAGPVNGGAGSLPAPVANCSADTYHAADGCDGANFASTTRHADFFTGYANQSRHAFITRPPWFVAGVDYPVGYYTPLESMKSPLDPTQWAGGAQGCALDAPNHWVRCNGRGADTLDIEHVDFSIGTGGLGTGTRLIILGGYSGGITIRDDNFKNGASSDLTDGTLIYIMGANEPLDIEFVTLDGNPAIPDHLEALVGDARSGSGATKYQYNAWLNAPARGLNMSDADDPNLKFNYVGNIMQGITAFHGEWYAIANVRKTFHQQYNTQLEDAWVQDPHKQGIEALTYLSDGMTTLHIVDAYIDHNTWVTNHQPNGGAESNYILSVAAQEVTHLYLTDNYYMPVGAKYCNGAGVLVNDIWSGNVNMYDGSTLDQMNVDYGNPKNVATLSWSHGMVTATTERPFAFHGSMNVQMGYAPRGYTLPAPSGYAGNFPATIINDHTFIYRVPSDPGEVTTPGQMFFQPPNCNGHGPAD